LDPKETSALGATKAALKTRAEIARIVISISSTPIAPGREPPAWDDDLGPMPEWDLLGQPEPDVEFDQRVSW
jgi:hypothetical protein